MLIFYGMLRIVTLKCLTYATVTRPLTVAADTYG